MENITYKTVVYFENKFIIFLIMLKVSINNDKKEK
jgi:hypothetical protein